MSREISLDFTVKFRKYLQSNFESTEYKCYGQIQDLGYMSDWDEADVAPASGYFPSGYSVQAIEGHVYAVKTGSPRNYGKIHVLEVNITDAWVSFKACYQTDPGNREYKIKP